MSAAKFKELWATGASAKAIATQLGLASEHYVYTRARQLRLKRRGYKQNTEYTKMVPYAEDIVYAVEEGISVAKIAEEIGVCRTYPYTLYHDVT
jgi:hypothetical protein